MPPTSPEYKHDAKTIDTTERVNPESYNVNNSLYVIFLLHLVAYKWFAAACMNKRILDFGCGTGYGAHLLSAAAAEVVGVDISESAIADARSKYVRPNLSYLLVESAERAALPFSDEHFDVVTSNQVIEHLADPNGYLVEVRRVLKRGGFFFCVTPNRRARLFSFQKPWNLYHVREYTARELMSLISPFFEIRDICGINGTVEAMDLEMRRVRRTRILTLPFTFAYLPEAWRRFGLSLLKGLAGRTTEMQPITIRDTDVWIGEMTDRSQCIACRAERA